MAEPRKGRVQRQPRPQSTGQKALGSFNQQRGLFTLGNAQTTSRAIVSRANKNQRLIQQAAYRSSLSDHDKRLYTLIQKFGEEKARQLLGMSPIEGGPSFMKSRMGTPGSKERKLDTKITEEMALQKGDFETYDIGSSGIHVPPKSPGIIERIGQSQLGAAHPSLYAGEGEHFDNVMVPRTEPAPEWGLLDKPAPDFKARGAARLEKEEEEEDKSKEDEWRPWGGSLGRALEHINPSSQEAIEAVKMGSVHDFLRRLDPTLAWRQALRRGDEMRWGLDDPAVQRELKPLTRMYKNIEASLDVGAQTIGEVIGGAGDVAMGNELKPLTLLDTEAGETFADRAETAIKNFDKRPWFEQLVLGLLDPFLVFGVAKATIRILPKLAVRTGIKKMSAEAIEKEATEKVLKELARKSTKASVLPTPTEVTALSTKPRVQPKSRLGKAVVGFWDASAKIAQMPMGAVRAAAQAALDFKKTQDIIDGFTQTAIAKINTHARQEWGMSFENMFGVGRGQPRAVAITQGRRVAAAIENVLSEEAIDLLKSVDEGGVPSFMTSNLAKIAKEHNIKVDASTTPNNIIDQLRAKATESKTINGISDEAMDLINKTDQDPNYGFAHPGAVLKPGLPRTTPGYIDTATINRIADEHGIKTDYTTSASDVINQLKAKREAHLLRLAQKEPFDLTESPFFGNVFEHQDDYVLTEGQKDMMRYIHEMNQDMLRMALAEGLDMKELGSLDDAFTYFQRIVRDGRGRKVIDASSKRGSGGTGGSIGKHRLYEQMDEKVLENGGKYGDPLDAINSYNRHIYTAIANKRMLDQMRPYAKSMVANQDILNIAKAEKGRVLRMRRTLRDVSHMMHGFTPTGPLVRSMKRLFPQLTEEIDAVRKLSPYEINQVSEAVSDEILTSVGVTREAFNESLLRASAAHEAFGPGVRLHDVITDRQMDALNKVGGDEITDLLEDWSGPGRNAIMAQVGPLALGNKAYQTKLHNLLRATFGKGNKIRVYRGEGKGRGEGVRDREFTNVSTSRRTSLKFPPIEVDAVEIDPKDVVALITHMGESELIVRARTVAWESVAGARTTGTGKRGASSGGTRQRILHVGDVILDEALANLQLKGHAASTLSGQARPAIRATMEKNPSRKIAAKALAQQMDFYFQEAKIASALANRNKRLAQDVAQGTGVTGARVPALSDQFVFDRADVIEMNKIFEDSGVTTWKRPAEISGALRKFRTVFDVGAPFIHGLPMLMSDPEGWAKATGLHYATLFDPITGSKGLRDKYLAENSEDIIEFLKNGGTMGSSEFTESMAEGGWFAALPTSIGESGRIPEGLKPATAAIPSVINRSSGHFANSFETFLDAARIETWKGMRTSTGTADLPELASYVNKMTGTSSSRALGVPLSQQQFEAALPFFAPRYFRSISALMLDTFTGGLRGSYARKAIGSMLSGVVLTHIATQQFLGQPVRLDPSKPAEFLRSDFMGQRVGFGTKPLSLIKAFIRITKGSYNNPDGFLNWDIMEQSTYDENPILSTLRYGSAPLASNMFNYMTGADALGREMPGFDDPAGILALATEQVSPFWLDAGLEVAIGAHSMSGSIVAGGTEFSGGVSFPIPIYDLYENELDKKSKLLNNGDSWEETKKLSEDAGKTEEREILNQFPELRELKVKVMAAREKRVTLRENREIFRIRERANKQWMEDANLAGEIYASGVDGDLSAKKFRDAISRASHTKRRALQNLEADHPEIFDLTDKYYDQLGETYPFLAAQTEYFDLITESVEDGGVLDSFTGRINYAAMDELKSNIDIKYGQGVMDQISAGLAEKRLTIHTSDGEEIAIHKSVAEWYDSHDVLRPYWDAFKEIVPEGSWHAWRVYQKSTPESQRELRRSKDLPFGDWDRAVEKKQRILSINEPDIDMALIMFYGRSPKNRDNKMELRKLWQNEQSSLSAGN
jgi:hypothetical protein